MRTPLLTTRSPSSGVSSPRMADTLPFFDRQIYTVQQWWATESQLYLAQSYQRHGQSDLRLVVPAIRVIIRGRLLKGRF
jgi:hypothetical protein